MIELDSPFIAECDDILYGFLSLFRREDYKYSPTISTTILNPNSRREGWDYPVHC